MFESILTNWKTSTAGIGFALAQIAEVMQRGGDWRQYAMAIFGAILGLAAKDHNQ
jgi:hypothetical protein